jgi:glyoxylase-like metal-dependent hydrolase (beta-lactamase superfamily II)
LNVRAAGVSAALLAVLATSSIHAAGSCPADFQGSGNVDGADLGFLLLRWGTAIPTADLNASGHVEGGDLGLLLNAWGPCPSCAGHCGGPSSGDCYCDALCFAFQDCCDDACAACPELAGCIDDPPGSCAGACGGKSDDGCWCDEACVGFDDCCEDFCDACPLIPPCDSGLGGPGCEGNCGGQSGDGCWCDVFCFGFADCCPDVCEFCEYTECLPTPTCDGICGQQHKLGCWCDPFCAAFADCCLNICEACPTVGACLPGGGCAGHCGGFAPDGCFCDEACFTFADCCSDVCTACSSLGCCVTPDESCAPPPPNPFPLTWIHGCPDCATCDDPPIQVHQYDEDTFILRQSKCLHFEAPFMFMMFGAERALLLDTGATGPGEAFPLAATVYGLMEQWRAKHGGRELELIVAHTHSHGDHVEGDAQFVNQPNTRVVGHGVESVAAVFGISDWREGLGAFDLGGRALDIIPLSGHFLDSIAVYDRRTSLLFTGDSLYPGNLFISSFAAYRHSIANLAEFAASHPVAWCLGNHIEMSAIPAREIPYGTVFQPREHVLQLGVEVLFELHEAIEAMADNPVEEIHDDFIIVPSG